MLEEWLKQVLGFTFELFPLRSVNSKSVSLLQIQWICIKNYARYYAHTQAHFSIGSHAFEGSFLPGVSSTSESEKSV